MTTEEFHIYPKDEEKLHVLTGTKCPCRPHVKHNKKKSVTYVIHDQIKNAK